MSEYEQTKFITLVKSMCYGTNFYLNFSEGNYCLVTRYSLLVTLSVVASRLTNNRKISFQVKIFLRKCHHGR